MLNQLLENLFVYKKTAALLAAFQLGLFRQIKKYGCLDKSKCCQLGWNEKYVDLLCVYLANENYLIEVDGGWQINMNFEKQMDSFEKICEHESTLYHKWLSPELIVSSVQSTNDNRPFDKEGFSKKEQQAYDNAMYGSNINLIAFHLLRKIKRDRISHIRCLKYGRSNGQAGQVFRKHMKEISVDVAMLGQPIDGQSQYDLILIYNTIHYAPLNEWQIIFNQMKKVLDNSGIICIADVFYKKDNIFQSTVLLDWITHGGVYNIYSNEVVEQLQSIGFTKIEQQFIDSISTDLLFVYK